MALTSDFEKHAKDVSKEAALQIDKEIQGLKSDSVAGVMERSATATFNQQSKAAERADAKKREDFNVQVFLILLQNERDHYSGLRQDAEKDLKDKYGDDFLTVLAEKYLNENDLEGLETDDDKRLALAERMLENGRIKPEFADNAEAQYIFKWYQEHLRDVALEHAQNGDAIPSDIANAMVPADETSGTLKHITLYNESLAESTTAYQDVEQQADKAVDLSAATPTSSWGQ